MKVYRYGEQTKYYNIIIEEDDGTIKVGFVKPTSVVEYVATPTKLKDNQIRLTFGNGSSMPYKDKDGNLIEKYTEITNFKII